MTTIELRPSTYRVTNPHTASLVAGTISVNQSAKLALVSAAAAVPPITVLHLSATNAVDPASWTISDYVVTLPYGIPLFAMTTAALALGAAGLAKGLRRVAGTRTVRVLLATWSAAVLALAVFPTNVRGTPETVSSNVHLMAGAVVFAVLPIAGLLLARWQRSITGRTAMTVALTAISAVSAVLSTALILNRLPGVIGMPELMLPPGLLQRVAGAVEIAVLAVAAMSMLRSTVRFR
jgi:Protein of unknown function (DUF998)